MNEHFRIAGAQEIREQGGSLFQECFLASEDIKQNIMNLNELLELRKPRRFVNREVDCS